MTRLTFRPYRPGDARHIDLVDETIEEREVILRAGEQDLARLCLAAETMCIDQYPVAAGFITASKTPGEATLAALFSGLATPDGAMATRRLRRVIKATAEEHRITRLTARCRYNFVRGQRLLHALGLRNTGRQECSPIDARILEHWELNL